MRRILVAALLAAVALAVTPAPAQAAGPFVYPTFKGDGAADQELWIYQSTNATSFSVLADTNYRGPSGVLRDPSIIRYNNRYYIAYTVQSWTTNSTYFNVATSTNLTTWTHVASWRIYIDRHTNGGIWTATDVAGYSRHAYSTHTGPWYGASAGESPVDSHVALVDALGRPSHRRPFRPLEVRGRVAVSRHLAHWPVGVPPAVTWPPREPEFRAGPWVTTASVLRGAVEVRLARVEDGGEAYTLRIGGHAIAADVPPLTTVDGATARVRRADGLTASVTGLRGLPVAGVVESEGVDAYGVHSAVPYVTGERPVQCGYVYAATCVIHRTTDEPQLPDVTATPHGAVTISWPDGAEDTVRFAPEL